MKRILPFLAIFGACKVAFTQSTDSLSLTSAAEQETVQTENHQEKRVRNYRLNNVKVNVSSLLLNTYNVYYERMLTRKISVSGGIRILAPTLLSDNRLIREVVSKFQDEEEVEHLDVFGLLLNNTTLSSKTLTAEFRFYGGRKPGARGFYFSLFGRYAQFDTKYPGSFTTPGKVYPIPLSAKTNAIAAGFTIGAQWLIGNRVVLDWYILGAQYGKLNGKLKAITDLSDLTESERNQLRQNINGVLEVGERNYLDSRVNDNGVSGTVKGPFAGIRAAGISLGIAF